ncbi:MAG: SAM hydrolase/SAM-dependent halogenase family protein, partial [Terriglobales bacterium]
YVGAMKGVIYNIHPAATVVDISHSVQSYDLLDGALTIAQSYSYYPKDTIHVVVVDPGVGTSRRPILVNAGGHYFIAPDNGVLSLVYEREERITVRHITSSHYFVQPVSQTFHGRDVFAAVAGWLSKGVESGKFGDTISDYVRFTAPRAKTAEGNQVKGIVLKVDKFGSLITNLTPADVPEMFGGEFKISVGNATITKLATNYAEGVKGEVFAILGSGGLLEISVNKGSAAQASGAAKGSEVVVTMG